MSERIEQVTSELSQLADEARLRFGALSPAQLNWKPSPEKWSVGQCLDHLVVIHGLYFPLLERLALPDGRDGGDVTPSLWERLSPFSGVFGRFLMEAMSPQNPKKTKTPKKSEPSHSEIPGDIVERFRAHQEELVEHLRSLPPSIDPERTIITSPLLGLVTYSLDDCLSIFVLHGQRHFGQASRVMESDGFPG